MKDNIQSLWIGKELSNIEQLCICSFLNNGSEFHLYTYHDVKNIPEGTTIKDANEIIPESDIFTNKKGSYGAFSDWFRFEMIYKKGGFYVDMDMICLKPFDFEDQPIIFGKETEYCVSSAIMKFPRKSETCRFMADICKNPNQILSYDLKKDKIRKLKRRYFKGNDRSNVGWGETAGPIGFTKYLKHKNMLDQAKPFTYFYPVHSENWITFFDETFKDNMTFFSGSYTAHLWNEMLRVDNIDKNKNFPENSFFEKLKKKHINNQ